MFIYIKVNESIFVLNMIYHSICHRWFVKQKYPQLLAAYWTRVWLHSTGKSAIQGNLFQTTLLDIHAPVHGRHTKLSYNRRWALTDSFTKKSPGPIATFYILLALWPGRARGGAGGWVWPRRPPRRSDSRPAGSRKSRQAHVPTFPL